MASVSVQIETSETNSAGFRATAGRHQSVGRTMGEALDALLAEWDDTAPAADVRIEPLPEDEEYVEPYLTNEGGFWVIAGGRRMSPEDAQRDFVAEMREERIRSFFPDTLGKHDESSS